ncbi:MAG TPA: EAL domain-containing protein [Candidatus Dormibacteraeota bacterium]|nr:EAL domain-containing protein [Candidatus Dormibacteraeota bacterium]
MTSIARSMLQRRRSVRAKTYVDVAEARPSVLSRWLAWPGRLARVAAVTACGVCLVAAVVLLQLDGAERLASQRQLELGRLAGDVSVVSADVWQALAQGSADTSTLATFHTDWAAASHEAAALKAEAPHDARVAVVLLAFDAYVADVDQTLSLLRQGSAADAARFQVASVEPSLGQLEAATAKVTAAYAADAQVAAADKSVGSVLTLIVAASLVIGLLVFIRRIQARAERRFRALVDHSNDVFAILDAQGAVRYESPAATRTLGYEPANRLGTEFAASVVVEDAPGVTARLVQLGRIPWAEASIEFGYRTSAGAIRRLEAFAKNLLADPAVGGIVLTYRDVTEKRALEEQLRRQAFEDPLTGLSNRALLRDRLDHALKRSRRATTDQRVALYFLDLDDFKIVNDSLGHAAGDALLAAVGERLRSLVRAVDTVARLGGDEFAVLAEDIGPEADPTELGKRILAALGRPFRVGNDEIFVRASIGYAVASTSDDSATLLRNADLAMYQAKADGKALMRRYDPALHASAVARRELERDLRRALAEQELFVVYQPIVSLRDGALVGMEALARWQHPTRGLLGPDAFIPAAEEFGLIVELGRWVLREACRQLKAWTAGGEVAATLPMSVNVSASQLRDPAFVGDVVAALRSSGLDGSRLTLELTESMLIDDSDVVIERLNAIRALGVRIAIDDFGAGFSALGYLRRFPIDVLKIDRTFVRGMHENSADAAVIQAAIGVADTLGLETVAEGIERPEQRAALEDLGFDQGQGFLFSRPVEAEAIGRALRQAGAETPAGHATPTQAPDAASA